MTYMAIVFKPVLGEVVFAVVSQITTVQHGPVAAWSALMLYRLGLLRRRARCRYSFQQRLPRCYPFRLTVFQQMPEDMKFELRGNNPMFTSAESEMQITLGAEVRLRVKGTRVDATAIVSS